MKRLTKWVDPAPKNDCFPYGDSASQYTTKNKHAAINKLGRLEDFEKDIGIDLEVALKAMMTGVWAFRTERSKKPTFFSTYHCIISIVGGVYLYLSTDFKWKDRELWYLLADYGKTWALTEEELEEKR